MPKLPLKPFWQTSDNELVRLYQGDVIDVLKRLPSQSVHCVVTSPPYWGLRDYGTADWEGGDPECNHTAPHGVPISERPSGSHQVGKGGSTHIAQDVKPYRGICKKCGAKRIDSQIGSEQSPDCLGWATGNRCEKCHVCKMVEVFREVRRVLRDDGTLWLNYGDTYAANNYSEARTWEHTEETHKGNYTRAFRDRMENNTGKSIKVRTGLKSGNLVGIPWRVALALQADGWVLRQDIIWCLSGGTWVYVRSQKGDMPMMMRDIARLDPATVKLWNGEKWTQLLGIGKTKRKGTEIEFVLRSGERISCTPEHQFPTTFGLKQAKDLRIGDHLKQCVIPQPDYPKRPEHLGLDAAWFAGLYLAEGCGVSVDKIQIAGHRNEIERWNRVKKIVEDYGGYCTLAVDGNNQNIRIHGKLLCAVIRELVSGKTAKDKGISPVVWRYDNSFLESYMRGYLSGDGGKDVKNKRHRLGFTRNYNLERDIRTACARLGWSLTLKTCFSKCDGKLFPSFRGEIREAIRDQEMKKDRCEIVEIRKSRCREVYDLSVEDAPHLFSLASGILTHNCKPSPMPESVRNRCTKSHEYIFLFAKSMKYFYDAEAIREPLKMSEEDYKKMLTSKSRSKHHRVGTSMDSGCRGKVDGPNGYYEDNPNSLYVPSGANKRSVWSVASQGYDGAHFATFPEKLIEPCILAGASEHGCCAECGAPWKRVTEQTKLKRDRPNDYVKRKGEKGTGNSCANSVAGVETKTIGWEPGCDCGSDKVPCTVLDPFIGSGTTCCVALANGRNSIGIDLSESYLRNNAIPRIEGELLARPKLAGLTGRKIEMLDVGEALI